jgi:hypothetical protein
MGFRLHNTDFWLQKHKNGNCEVNSSKERLSKYRYTNTNFYKILLYLYELILYAFCVKCLTIISYVAKWWVGKFVKAGLHIIAA